LWLSEQWAPARPFSLTSRALFRDDGIDAGAHHVGRHSMTPEGVAALYAPGVRDQQSANYCNWERLTLAQASLWWVDPNMVDLLVAARASVPDDIPIDQLTWPDRAGFAVFGVPIEGVSQHGTPIEVNAVAWGPTLLPPLWAWSDRNGVRALSVSSYCTVDLDAGLRPEELGWTAPLLAAHIESGNVAVDDEGQTRHAPPGSRTLALHGNLMVPLGRSDWPMGHTIADASMITDTDAELSCFMDDRKTITALFTLLQQEGLAGHHVETPARHIVRRTQRAGYPKEAAQVRVVTLRRVHEQDDDVEASEGDGTPGRWSHRWIVNGHWRNQPFGKGRAQRRLVWIAPYVKGPEDKDLATPTVVKAWKR
jgi:hypothetical protein